MSTTITGSGITTGTVTFSADSSTQVSHSAPLVSAILNNSGTFGNAVGTGSSGTAASGNGNQDGLAQLQATLGLTGAGVPVPDEDDV